jgi:glucose/mannose-6-phosphate isomerase
VLEPAAIAKVDRDGMRALVAALPEQLAEGLRRGLGTPASLDGASRIFLAGMGGSAIASDLFAAWVEDRTKVPVRVVRGYRLPPAAKPGDVLVAVSYSGETEETLSAAAEGRRIGCRLVAVTSGGSLGKLARDARAPVVEVPAGLPPRGAFGHLFGILAAIGEDWVYGNLKGELERAIAHLQAVRGRWAPDVAVRENRAKQLASRLKGRVPVVYGTGPFESVATRWQTQLNENAKVLAFSSAFPEADHNELVGWCSDPTAKRFAPIVIRDLGESAAMRARLDATVEMMGRHTEVEQVSDDHEELLSRLLGVVSLGDYVSLYLAVLRGVNPFPVEPLVELKNRLARPSPED